MLIEVRTVLERAATSRTILEGVLDVVPATHWQRSEPGASWSARNHLEHVATIDTLLEAELERPRPGGGLWLGGTSDETAFAAIRQAAMAALASHDVAELRMLMREARRAVAVALAGIGAADLDARLLVPGTRDAWGAPLSLSLREYVAAWATHDREHADAIRRAITTPPDLSTAVLTMQRRRN